MFRWIDTASLGTRLLVALVGWVMIFAVIAIACFVSLELSVVVGVLALVGAALVTGMRVYPGVRVYPHGTSDRALDRAVRRGRD
jgi:hypothetical protein